MKVVSIAILLSWNVVSIALEHPVSYVEQQTDQRRRLHEAYNGFIELQNEFSHHRSDVIELDDRNLAVGESLLCRVQLASCQTLAANVEM